MSTNWGTVPVNSVLPFFFDSFAGATGASITMTGLALGDILVYKGTSMTQRASTAGFVLLDTDGIDVDTITGIHGFSIDTSDNTDAGFYAVGSFFTVVVASITVDGQTVNFVAGTFRLAAAEGVAGVPDVNVTHVGDTAQTAGDIMADTNDIQTRLPAALVGGRMDSSVGAMAAATITAAAIATDAIDADAIADNAIDAASIATGAITSAKFAAGAIDAAAIAANAIGASELATDAVNEIVDQVWDELRSDHVAVNSFGQSLAAIRSATAAAGAAGSITLDASASATDDFYNNTMLVIIGGTGANQSRIIEDYTGATQVATVSPNWVTTPDATSVFVILPFDDIPGASAPSAATIATAVVEKTLTEGYAADGAAGTLQQTLSLILQMLTEMSISGTTMTVKKLDGSTTAATFTLTLDSDNLPTAITRTT